MAASFVDSGKTVCDVGCDHGKLSLYLLQSGKAERIIATDINKAPLQKAVDLITGAGYSQKAEFYLTDGLQNIGKTDDVSHVVIAGLGGQTMAQIIHSAPFIKENKVRLVLLPAQSGHTIRKYLYENGFDIQKEKTVEEKGKFYSCISAVYTQNTRTADIFACYIGKSRLCEGYAAKGYFSMVYSQLEKKQKGFAIENGFASRDISEAMDKIKKLTDK